MRSESSLCNYLTILVTCSVTFWEPVTSNLGNSEVTAGNKVTKLLDKAALVRQNGTMSDYNRKGEQLWFILGLVSLVLKDHALIPILEKYGISLANIGQYEESLILSLKSKHVLDCISYSTSRESFATELVRQTPNAKLIEYSFLGGPKEPALSIPLIEITEPEF